MTDYSLLIELCESRLIPSQSSLKKWDAKELQQLAYFYFLALRILLSTDKTKTWAQNYCKKVAGPSDFDTWRTDGNDLYVLLYALNADEQFSKAKVSISVSTVRDWLNHADSAKLDEYTHRLFNRLDGMLHIHDSGFKATRRLVMQWNDNDAREREALIVKVIQQIAKLAPNGEVLSYLKRISKQYDDDVTESASAGATGASSIATAVGNLGGLGAGFDPNQKWRGVYGNKLKKPLIRRNSTE